MLFKDLKEYKEIERRYFKLCHFKGKGGSSTVTETKTIPTQSPEEAQLQGNLLDYDNKSLGQASSILDQAQSALNSVPTVDWNQELNNYNQTSRENLTDFENSSRDNLTNYNTTVDDNLTNYKTGVNNSTGDYVNMLDYIQSAYQNGLQDATDAYKQQTNNNLSSYNDQMQGVTQGYTDLSNGILPAAYAAARQKALQDDLASTVGTSISGLANRGVLNSSVTDSALNNIGQNASDTLAKNYDNDLATEAGLLGNRATNISNIYNTNQDGAKTIYDAANSLADKNYASSSTTAEKRYESLIDSMKNIYGAAQDTANSKFSNANTTANGLLSARNTANENSILGAAQAQAAAYTPVSNLYNYATQLYNPAQNMYNTMYGGRMGTASTTQTTTTNDGGAGMWQTMGQVGSAIAACFTGDTLITTPDGYKPIKDIYVGDDVLSIEDGKIVTKKVTHVNEPHLMPIVDIYFENGTIWHTTESQRYYDGKHFSFVDYMGSAIVFHGSPSKIVIWQGGGRKEPVYDFSVSGLNVFFANDVAAEGYGD